jgi:phosphate starvation-inducible PhoH-like protein
MKIKADKFKKLDKQFKSVSFKPKSDNQQKYVEYLNNKDISLILAIGPAGTGKTLFACMQAIQSLKNGEVNKIIITRPTVTVGEEELGYLPGNIMKKMEPWTQPIFDVFLQYFSKHEIDDYLFNGIIEVSPLAYMRGRTFRNAFVIADEMQNSLPSQMNMFVTRAGENSKMVITGDLNQSDKTDMNGLYNLMNKIDDYPNKEEVNESIKIIQFSNKDIERSKIVQLMVNIYSNYPRKQIMNNSKNFNNDAALIPRHHLIL